MNSRLKHFLDAENITQSQFADSLGVAKASISHILAGRNKPGFDFLVSLTERYPTLNLEWLMTGKGKMYNSVVANSLYEQRESKLNFEPAIIPQPSVQNLFPDENGDILSLKESHIPVRPSAPSQIFDSRLNKSERKISKIVVFYDDNSFEEIMNNSHQ